MSVDFIALKTTTSTEPTNIRNSSATVKHHGGTNQFQFRFHQFGLDVGGIGGVGSTQLLYSESNAFCNACHEGTDSPNSFCSDCTASGLTGGHRSNFPGSARL